MIGLHGVPKDLRSWLPSHPRAPTFRCNTVSDQCRLFWRVAILSSPDLLRHFHIRQPCELLWGCHPNERFRVNPFRLADFRDLSSLPRRGLGIFQVQPGQSLRFSSIETGFEPVTDCLGGSCSIQLSYSQKSLRRAVPVAPTAFDRKNTTRQISFTLLTLMKHASGHSCPWHCEAPSPAKARTSPLSLNIHRWTVSRVWQGLRYPFQPPAYSANTEASNGWHPFSETKRRLDDYFRFRTKPPLGDVGTCMDEPVARRQYVTILPLASSLRLFLNGAIPPYIV